MLNTKKLLNILLAIILLIFFIMCPIFISPKLLNQDFNINVNSQIDGGFLKIWHIEDFEGGSGNRALFLENISRKFEAKFKGWYVIVQNLTSEQALNSVSNGTLPDLISFSHHSGVVFENALLDYQGAILVRDDLVEYGKSNGKIKAIPWYLSGYCLIGNTQLNAQLVDTLSPQTMFSFGVSGKKTKPSLTVGLANYNMSFLATIKNNAQVGSTKDITTNYDTLTTFEAYQNFCDKSTASVLLGTARDYYRIKNKINLGSLPECVFAPLGKFSDLVGYMGISTTNDVNFEKCNEFIEFLTTENIQKQLSTIGLFSTTYNEIYANDEHYSKFEKILHRNLTSINIFMPNDEKQSLWKHSINATFGNKNSLNFVNNYL